jgi:hypothetical protein
MKPGVKKVISIKENESASSLHKANIKITETLEQHDIHQEIEVFNDTESEEALIIFTGLRSEDAKVYTEGKSRTFNEILGAFPKKCILLIHWPNVYLPEFFLKHVADFCLDIGIKRVSFWGRSFGGAATIEFLSYLHTNNIPIEVTGVALLVSPVSQAELRSIVQFQRGYGLNRFVPGANPHSSTIAPGKRSSRLARIRTKSYTRADFNTQIPILNIITNGNFDPMVDSKASIKKLNELFDRIVPLRLKGEPIVRFKNWWPKVNFQGSHVIAKEDIPTLQRALIEFLISPTDYIAAHPYPSSVHVN